MNKLKSILRILISLILLLEYVQTNCPNEKEFFFFFFLFIEKRFFVLN
jgi:hypothetical protein